METGASVKKTGRRLNMGDISKKGHGIERRGPHGHGSMPQLSTYNKGGRISKQLGGVGNTQPITGTQRFDQSRGYYQPDMGMRGGAMYNKGGRVGLKKGGNGKWIQKVNKSIKARGTKGKCTPITKKGCTGRAKALAKTFKKMAKKRKAA